MAKKQARSQLMELFFHVAELLGATTDREVAELADVSIDNVSNWRTGTVREFKGQTLASIRQGISARLTGLREQLRWRDSGLELGLIPLEIEENSGPAALQRQFADRMVYDYLGHRFLYFEPQGALAWEKLIREGYLQDEWLAAIEERMDRWLDAAKERAGSSRGVLGRALGFARRGSQKGLDFISLGPGEGGKEIRVLERLLAAQETTRQNLPWLTLALVDVSIPLLLTATKGAKAVRATGEGMANPIVLPICADFEEGSLRFVERLPSQAAPQGAGVRVVAVLGNVFGNLRDEERFLRQNMGQIIRPGDFLWLEIGERPERIEDDPVYPMTQSQRRETAAFSNRRLLLEGPYRRWEAALGRKPSVLETRIWVREADDTCRIPGSVNFCHDLVIDDERHVCTMLYSRRYEVESLTKWLEAREYAVRLVDIVTDTEGKQRVVHVLAQRR